MVRVVEDRAFAAAHAESLVADRPVDASVVAHCRAVHVVSAVADVDTKPGGEHLGLVGPAVPIGVGDLEHVRDAGHVGGVVTKQNAAGETGHLGV